ncbi:hypothetical protein HYR99_01305 [Candidatus Poribacteria bacterium]|nr:hypothetical protein [Candidatus Poribacteria bacterium]
MNIKSGDIIQSNRWSELVEINLLEEVGEYVRLVGVTIHSRGHIDQLLHRDEMNALQAGKLSPNFTPHPPHPPLHKLVERGGGG